MTNRETATSNRNTATCTFMKDNLTEFTADVALNTTYTKMVADTALAVAAGTAAAADNTGFSLDKLVAKEAVSILASDLCARSQVKLDSLGNHTISKALNSASTFYFSAADALAENRLQNVHDVMETNQVIITDDYVKVTQLTDLQTKITNYASLSGSSITVNNGSPVFTKKFKAALKVTNGDIGSIKKLVKEYRTSNPDFYNGVLKACKMPRVAVIHTTADIAITSAADNNPLPKVAGTLSKSKELPISNSGGIMRYTPVSAGAAIATFALPGFITGVMNINIKQSKVNTFAIALVAGTMTPEMEQAVLDKVAAFIANEETIRAKKEALKAERKAAKEAAKP